MFAQDICIQNLLFLLEWIADTINVMTNVRIHSVLPRNAHLTVFKFYLEMLTWLNFT